MPFRWAERSGDLIVPLVERLAYALVLLACVVILNFVLIRLAPGDPALVIAGEMGGASEEVVRAIRASYGLDAPAHEQLAIYLGKIVRGDLGHSFFFDRPVIDLITPRLGPTLLLVVTALFLSLGLGAVLGTLAAYRPSGRLSQLVSMLAVAGFSLPVFWSGIILILTFSLALGLFPVEGFSSVRLYDAPLLPAFLDRLHHLILPSVTLASVYVAFYARLARSSMREVLATDYIRMARAKGASETSVLFVHALRNASFPILTLAGLQFGNLLSGALLVETVFNWPGLGRLAFDSIVRRDHPTLLGLLLFSAALVILANLLTDLCYRLLDPRVGRP